VIFVSVGNATQPFSRLLDAVDALAGSDIFQNEPVVMQTGHNPDFRPRHSRTVDFMSMEQFQEHLKTARLVLCHAGCGTLLQAIEWGKVPVVMPRLARYGEHVNDHQLQLIRALAEENRIVPAYEVPQLAEAIREAWSRKPAPRSAGPMRDLVGQAIRELLDGAGVR
jgi:UDP-N-acetylglucosamine transferase subunit ALG13